MISLEKIKDFDILTRIAKNVGDLGKLIVAKGFEKLPKVHEIAQSGHTDSDLNGRSCFSTDVVDIEVYVTFC